MRELIARARWGFHGFTAAFRALMLPRPWVVDVMDCRWVVSDGVTTQEGEATSPRAAMRAARRAALLLAEQSHPSAT